MNHANKLSWEYPGKILSLVDNSNSDFLCNLNGWLVPRYRGSMGWGSSACPLMAVEADARSTSPAASRTDKGVGGNC